MSLRIHSFGQTLGRCPSRTSGVRGRAAFVLPALDGVRFNQLPPCPKTDRCGGETDAKRAAQKARREKARAAALQKAAEQTSKRLR